MSDDRPEVRAIHALQELKRRRAAAPLAYVEYHDGQKRVIDAKKRKRGVICNAGNRFGKSVLNAALSICHAYGYWIHEVPNLRPTREGHYPPRAEIPPKFWIRRPDGVPLRMPNRGLMLTGLNRERGIGGVLFPAVEQWLPQKTLKDWGCWRGPLSIPMRVQFPHGSEIYFGSAEQDPSMFEGMSYDWVSVDEPPPRAVWGAVFRGMTDFFAPYWFTMTPIGRNAPYIHQEFVVKERDDVELVAGSIHDNPYISADAKRAFLEDGDYTEEELSARESGTWSFLSHRAFPSWDPAAHVVDTRRPPTGWTRLLSVDPAHRRPYAMVWVAFGPNGEVEVYDEYPFGALHYKLRTSTLTVPDYAALIRNREGDQLAHHRLLDPRFGVAEWAVKGDRHTSIQDDFRRCGMRFDCNIPGTGEIETGVERIRSLMRWDRKAPLSPPNVPRLRVQRHCVNVIASLSQWNFAPPSVRDALELPERLQEAWKDHADALRYAVLYPRPARNPNTGYLDRKDFDALNDPFAG